ALLAAVSGTNCIPPSPPFFPTNIRGGRGTKAKMAQEQASNDWLSPMQELRDIRDRLNRRPEGRFDHPVMKVNQFDAYVLDSELLDLVRHQVHRGLAFFRAGTMEQYKPEIDALLSFLLYWTTVLQNKPTPGMALQNLVYHDAFGAAT
ncbi:unnamed protein product, partial [Heterosigma akashiwo]